MTDGKTLKDMTDEELIEVYKGAYSNVEISDCFNNYDLLMLESSESLLGERGYSFYKQVPRIIKDGDNR